jgi:tetratricopeptide (TPR) repeat protein
MLIGIGDYEKAVADLPDVVAALRKILTPEDRSLLEAIHTLAFAYHQLGRDVEAEPLVREAVDTRRRTIGAAHPQTLESMHMLAAVLEAAGRTEETRPLYEELLTVRRAEAMKENATPGSKRAYAELLATTPFEDLRDVAEAVRFATAAADAAGDTDYEILDTLAVALAAAGRRAEAADAQRRALEILPPNSANRAEYERRLAEYSGSEEAPPPK